MLCLYPVEGAPEDHPGIDEVRYSIAQAMLPRLEREIAQTGQLVHTHETDDWNAHTRWRKCRVHSSMS